MYARHLRIGAHCENNNNNNFQFDIPLDDVTISQAQQETDADIQDVTDFEKYLHPSRSRSHTTLFAMLSLKRICIQTIKCHVSSLVHPKASKKAKSGPRHPAVNKLEDVEVTFFGGNDVRPTVGDTPLYDPTAWPIFSTWAVSWAYPCYLFEIEDVNECERVHSYVQYPNG